MTIPLRQLGDGPEPAENRPQPVRDWLTAAITAADCPDCPDCRDLRSCPPHAADAVLDACRQERLIIMPVEDADAIIAPASDDRVYQ
ncbi:hypothetical protein [Couchioplanes caeruleus]|uniref:Uncharacterized protein n=2 Tax=Couchioplanes caeruleus TaxID=56438 RepID=A0A1K0FRG2_9ACTN|nr:hypothetical protein [Couchioplanes caeruleus]OJF15377.1 hypothetical protein BG844_04560 [Couchioplanes caeruleus subsp. caeruleus]ROP33415.1 hypothetical protein EDD30_6394 [Couchioplanes caeruleus]